MTDKTVAADLSEKLFGTPNTVGTDAKSRLLRVALRLLAAGEPITRAQLADAAGVSELDPAPLRATPGHTQTRREHRTGD